MTRQDTEELARIDKLMLNGQWAEAIKLFQSINCSAQDFSEYLGLGPKDEYELTSLRDFALLGFYSREFKPMKGK